jgi:hypothetical protein
MKGFVSLGLLDKETLRGPDVLLPLQTLKWKYFVEGPQKMNIRFEALIQDMRKLEYI